MPLYQLLGGASPDRAHGLRARLRRGTCRSCSTRSASTWSWATGRSGCRPRCPGINAGLRRRRPAQRRREAVRLRAGPARRRCRPRRTGTPAPTCATCPAVFEAVRNEFGPELPLLHDGHHRMTPIQAARLGKDLEPYDLFWLEDCTPGREPGGAAPGPPAHHHPAGDRRGLQHGVGLPDPDPRAADRLRALGGRPTPAASRAHEAGCWTTPRSTRSSPASTGRPTSPRSAWPRRCTWTWRSTTSASRSTCSTADLTNEVFRQSFTFVDGYLHPGEKPGLGVETRRGRGRRASRTSRPTCRSTASQDGTVHDW